MSNRSDIIESANDLFGRMGNPMAKLWYPSGPDYSVERMVFAYHDIHRAALRCRAEGEPYAIPSDGRALAQALADRKGVIDPTDWVASVDGGGTSINCRWVEPGVDHQLLVEVELCEASTHLDHIDLIIYGRWSRMGDFEQLFTLATWTTPDAVTVSFTCDERNFRTIGSTIPDRLPWLLDWIEDCPGLVRRMGESGASSTAHRDLFRRYFCR